MAEDEGGERSVTTAQADSLTWPCPWPPLHSGPPLAPLALQLRSDPGALARHLQHEARGTPPEDGRGEGYTDGLSREVGTRGMQLGKTDGRRCRCSGVEGEGVCSPYLTLL